MKLGEGAYGSMDLGYTDHDRQRVYLARKVVKAKNSNLASLLIEIAASMYAADEIAKKFN